MTMTMRVPPGERQAQLLDASTVALITNSNDSSDKNSKSSAEESSYTSTSIQGQIQEIRGRNNPTGPETQSLLHESNMNTNGVIPNANSSCGAGAIAITITPVSSIPDSMEGREGSTPSPQQYLIQPSINWRTLMVKLSIILGLLYLFVCSLGFLSDSFRLIAGRAAGEVLQKEKLIKNPIVGVMMGIIVTVAVQSSSTSTSIVVSMVASGLFSVKTAIPIIMGANIGTSVTNTVVALTHMSNREDFERAFSGAVLHDMFNLLTVSSLLIVESLTSYLELTTTRLVDMLDLTSKKGGEIQVLSVITKPFTSLIIQLRKDVIIGWSINDPKYDNARLVKVWCNSSSNSNSVTSTSIKSIGSGSFSTADNSFTEASDANKNSSNDVMIMEDGDGQKCKFLFNLFNLGDKTIGIILLAISLVLLCGCLILLVKVLSSLLKGKLAIAVQKGVNAQLPYLPCLTGYLAIGIGAIMTILVQSSSVFTSAMTPLIAMGMISLERAYPLTLGSNLGTTTTAMLAALATEGPNLKLSIQLALCHFLFNLTGILLFYPIPQTRFPIRMAARLGKVTAKYRWFAVFYLIFMFVILPLLVFTLTMLGPLAFYFVAGVSLLVIGFSLGLNLLQNFCPLCLPHLLRNWDFLPLWCHSLEPYDRLVQRGAELWAKYFPWCCTKRTMGVGVQMGVGLGVSEGLRGNRSSEICFADGSRSPSPGFEFDNQAFTRNDHSFIELRAGNATNTLL